MSIDLLFDADHQPAIVFFQNINTKNENREVRVPFDM